MYSAPLKSGTYSLIQPGKFLRMAVKHYNDARRLVTCGRIGFIGNNRQPKNPW